LLASRVNLDVFSLIHDADEAAQVGSVQKLGARVAAFPVPHWTNRLRALPYLLGSRPLTHLLLTAPGIDAALRRLVQERPPDVVLAYCSGMARFATAVPLSAYPLVIDLVDVDSAKWAALSNANTGPMRWIYRREARTLASFERAASLTAKQTLVVN